MTQATLLARRLANFRRGDGDAPPRHPSPDADTRDRAAVTGRYRSAELAERLAVALAAEAVVTAAGTVVRVEQPSRAIPLDRDALASLPGQPPAHVPLVCLDTETTGLATAAGTVAFLVGVGLWQGQQFREVQLLLPDQPDEPALLDMLASLIPAGAWLVTYNGRGFDWPLLVARYRMARRDAPAHSGHLDLLSTVRRLFRHRMSDARLRSAEESLLGVGRVDDVEGWEIPGRYLSFLRGGDARRLIPVVDHNARDVHSLARLLVHLVDALGDHDRRRHAPDGDLLGLARAFRREGRLTEAMDCLDLAVGRASPPADPRLAGPRGAPAAWLVDRSDGIASAIAQRSEARAVRLIGDQLARERGRLLRNLGRLAEAREAWRDLATRNGPLSAIAWVELAKVLEHVERDFAGALDAVTAAQRLADRSASIGRPLPMLASDLAHRRARLTRRLAASDPEFRSESRAMARGDQASPDAVPDGSTRRHAAEPPALHHQ